MTQAEAGLSQRLLAHIESEPDAIYCEYVSFDGTVSSITRGEMLRSILRFATTYRTMMAAQAEIERDNIRAKQRLVCVCLYPGQALHAAFWGAVWVGCIPTILAPPSPRMEKSKYADSFQQMLVHTRPNILVCDEEIEARLAESGIVLNAVTATSGTAFLVPTALIQNADDVDFFAPHVPNLSDIALLQHSSGTTGLQKGVALSHGAILRHNRSYTERLQIQRDDVIVSWLPLYHDMGLIACFLLPSLEGVRLVEMSPFDWVRKPTMLFEQIDRTKGTLCWLPNFAFSFMAKHARHLDEAISTASIRAWINCSEPVYWTSMRTFVERFANHGVRVEQLATAYAMAENVFAVSQSDMGGLRLLKAQRGPFITKQQIVPIGDIAVASLAEESGTGSADPIFVSNGKPISQMQVRIVDDGRHSVDNGTIGELELHGTFSFNGYFHREDLTAQALTDDGWYRTGDMGFLWEGEVYVTGRQKDLLIIQGRNFYPADIESCAAEVEGVHEGRVVAFSWSDESAGTEQLIILGEVLPDYWEQRKRVALRIRNHVAQRLDCTAHRVEIVPSRWLIKSTSGKPARHDNRKKYLARMKSGEEFL